MEDIEDTIVTYMVKLMNDGMTSVLRAEISSYMNSIGIRGCEDNIDNLIRKKVLLPLKNGKITLNLVKLKKKQKF